MIRFLYHLCPEIAVYLYLKFTLSFSVLLLLLFCNSVCCRPEPQIALRRHSNGTLSINGSIQLDELCSQLPDGTYPDYTQACRMFFICSRGKKVATFWCTKGFVFSLTSGHCEPPDRAMCPDYQNPSVLDEVISFHVDDEECSQGDGVYPNFDESCSSFHVCRGEKQLHYIVPHYFACFSNLKVYSNIEELYLIYQCSINYNLSVILCIVLLNQIIILTTLIVDVLKPK
ncbi:UNVERIFIED_CONTAM: hypothetical protein NCL1_27251 [Trichonephila clavipes]